MSATEEYPRHYAYPLVTWGSTFLGAVVAVMIAAMLNILGGALGVASVSMGASQGVATDFGIASIIWVAVANILALGFGAWVAGRATANPDHHGGTLQGIAVWAVTSFAVILLAGSALTGVTGIPRQTVVAVVGGPAAPAGTQPAAGAAAPTSPAAQPSAAAIRAATTAVAEIAAAAAFGTFLSMVLGLIAAIIGARIGARHPNWADRPRYTIVERRHGTLP